MKKKNSKILAAWHKQAEEEGKERVRKALARGGFVCPGCGSDDYASHSYDCLAAVVAAAYGLTLIEMHQLLVRNRKKYRPGVGA